MADKTGSEHITGLEDGVSVVYGLLHMHRKSAASKCAGLATMKNEATLVRLAYGGTYSYKLSSEAKFNDISGTFENICDLLVCVIRLLFPKQFNKANVRVYQAADIMGPTLSGLQA